MTKYNMDVKVALKWKNICKGSCAAHRDLTLDWHKARKAEFEGVTTNL